MKATFEFGGLILDIANDAITSRDTTGQFSGSGNAGHVGIQATSVSLDGTEQKTVMLVFMLPSEARAVASAMLSAATECSGKGKR